MSIKTLLKYVLIFGPALLSFIPYIFSYINFQPDLVILPGVNKHNVHTYGDSADSSGNSQCTLTKVTDSTIIFDYTLRKSNLSTGRDPYAGVAIDLNLKESKKFYDISPYNYIDVDIVTKQGTSFKIQLKSYIEGFTVLDEFWTYFHKEKQVEVHLGSIRYRISIDSIATPNWFPIVVFRHIGAGAAKLPPDWDKTKLFGINFQSSYSTPENVPDRFEVIRVAFVKDRSSLLTILNKCTAVFIGYIALVLLLQFIIKHRKQILSILLGDPNLGNSELFGSRKTDSATVGPDQSVIATADSGTQDTTTQNSGQSDIHRSGSKPIISFPTIIIPEDPVKKLIEEDAKRIIDYINANYSDPEMDEEQVAHGTLMQCDRVRTILKDKFNKSFPAYLNEIRINAAKEWLITTTLGIGQIAMKVGYNNFANFNRVFRQFVDMTPMEYRYTYKKTKEPSDAPNGERSDPQTEERSDPPSI